MFPELSREESFHKSAPGHLTYSGLFQESFSGHLFSHIHPKRHSEAALAIVQVSPVIAYTSGRIGHLLLKAYSMQELRGPWRPRNALQFQSLWTQPNYSNVWSCASEAKTEILGRQA